MSEAGGKANPGAQRGAVAKREMSLAEPRAVARVSLRIDARTGLWKTRRGPGSFGAMEDAAPFASVRQMGADPVA